MGEGGCVWIETGVGMWKSKSITCVCVCVCVCVTTAQQTLMDMGENKRASVQG